MTIESPAGRDTASGLCDEPWDIGERSGLAAKRGPKTERRNRPGITVVLQQK